MTCAGGAEQPGTVVLGIGTPLETEQAVRAQPEDVDSAMAERATMDLPAEIPADDTVMLVDDIEDLVR
jgi:hypothetical protein